MCVYIFQMFMFLPVYLALDDGSTAPVPLRPRPWPRRQSPGSGLASHDSGRIAYHSIATGFGMCNVPVDGSTTQKQAMTWKVAGLSALDTDEASDLNSLALASHRRLGSSDVKQCIQMYITSNYYKIITTSFHPIIAMLLHITPLLLPYYCLITT